MCPPSIPVRALRRYAGLFVLLAATSAQADVKTWISTGNTAFSENANWDPAGAPTASDVATFNTKTSLVDPSLTANHSVLGVNFTAGGWTLGGSGILSVGADGVSSSASSGAVTVNATIAGTGGVVKSGASILTLAGLNTYTGKTTVSGGYSSNLYFNSVGNLGAGPSALGNPTDETNGTITYGTSGGQLRYTGTGHATNRKLELQGSGFCILDALGTGALVWNGDVTVPTAGSKTFSLRASSTADNAFNGLIANGSGTVNFEIYAPSGKWTIGNNANSYTGTTHLAAGTLTISSLANAGIASALGAATGTNATIKMGYTTTAGTLRYVGPGHSTNRLVDFVANGTGGGAIDASGTGALVFTGNFTGTGGTAAKTLTLTGTSAGSLMNAISGAIFDSAGGPTSLLKSGSNTWSLTGPNTYTGTTTISAGTLVFNSIGNVGAGASSLGNPATAANGAIRVSASSTLRYTGDGDSTDRALELTGTGSTRLGFESNGSGALIWDGNVNITGAASTTSYLSLRGNYAGTNEFNGLLANGSSAAANHRLSVELYTSSPASLWKIGRNDNTFSGEAFLARGILIVEKLADAGTPSSLGTGSTVPTIKIGWTSNSPVLRYIGTGDSTNRPVSVGSTNDGGGSGGAILEANGSGALEFTGNFTGPATNGTAKTLTLRGTSDPGLLNAITGAIADGNTSAGRTTSLVKSGGNTWVLGGANTYTGPTTVSEGRLLINGDQSAATGAVTIADGATLGGIGTIGGATALAGTHAPGQSPGLQTFAAGLSYGSTAVLEWELTANTANGPGTNYDQVLVSGGNLQVDSAATLSLLLGSSGSSVDFTDPFWGTPRNWTVIDHSGSGTSTGWFGSLVCDLDYSDYGIFRVDNANGDVRLQWSPVPEPSSLAMCAALVGCGAWLRRRRGTTPSTCVSMDPVRLVGKVSKLV